MGDEERHLSSRASVASRGICTFCQLWIDAHKRFPEILRQGMLEEEAYELVARREVAGGTVAIVAIAYTAGPGVAAALDGEEGDVRSAARETDLAYGRRRM